MRGVSTLAVAAVAVLLALSAPAAADLRFQAEGGSFSPRSVRVVKDRGAGGRRAVLLVGRGELRKRVSSSALARMAIRARGIPCRGRPRLRARIDDFLAGTVRARSRRWRIYRMRAPAKAGSHTIRLSLVNPLRTRHCRRRLLLDSVRLIAASRKAPAPVKPPGPSPQAAAGPPTFTNPVWPA